MIGPQIGLIVPGEGGVDKTLEVLSQGTLWGSWFRVYSFLNLVSVKFLVDLLCTVHTGDCTLYSGEGLAVLKNWYGMPHYIILYYIIWYVTLYYITLYYMVCHIIPTIFNHTLPLYTLHTTLYSATINTPKFTCSST